MTSPRSSFIGALLESLAFGIGTAVSLIVWNRTGLVGHLAIAGSMVILALLALWRAWGLRAGEAAAPTSGARLAQSMLAVTAIALLLSGVYLNVAV
jgi:hypothetical protein